MIKAIIRKLFNAMGYEIVPLFPLNVDKAFQVIYQECKYFTVTSVERMYALYKSVQYVEENDIPGDIVECGVWKGGSSMLCTLTLKELGNLGRSIYMYDTYSGMTQPTEKDVDYKGNMALDKWIDFNNEWCTVPLEDVKRVMYSTEYPTEHIKFIKGKVEDTIPGVMPDKIALLRLDTDWYESTYHELLYLYPKLSPGGILIIDDYGHFKGVKEATDKYIHENNIKMLLHRIDYTGRIGIK